MTYLSFSKPDLAKYTTLTFIAYTANMHQVTIQLKIRFNNQRNTGKLEKSKHAIK
jgi:hypothetical protein